MNIIVFRDKDVYPCLITFRTEFAGEFYESRPPVQIFNQRDYDSTIPLLKETFEEDVKRKSRKPRK